MAITITDQPNPLTVKGQKLIYTATSNNSGATNFKYIVEVFNGALTSIAKLYIPQNPQGVLIFDLAEIIREEVKVDTEDYDNQGLIHTLPNASLKFMSKAARGIDYYTIQIGEVYGDPLVEYLGLSTSNKYITSGALQAREGYKNPLTNYIASSSSVKGFLTERQASVNNTIDKDLIEIRTNELDYGSLAVWNDSTVLSSTATRLRYRIYDSTGALFFSQALTFSTVYASDTPGSATISAKLTYFGAFPGNINKANHPITTKPSTVPNWKYYTWELIDSGSSPVSQPIIFLNTPNPCKHNPVTLAWANSLGAWDYFRLDARTGRTITTTAKNYQKTLGDYSNSTYSFNTWDRQRVPYQVDAKLRYSLNSESLTKEDTQLLKNVIKSKNVMLYIDEAWLPVTVITSSFRYETETISKRLTASFEVELSQVEQC
jgi:hypothetical protein